MTDEDGIADNLKKIGAMADADIDIAEAALGLAVMNHPGLVLDRYREHLKKIARDVAERHEALLKDADGKDSLSLRAEALRAVLADSMGYTGDSDSRDKFESSDFIRVIDSRCGVPVTLSILYLHAARAQGWTAHGLNIPGHFVVRLDLEGERMICDPFDFFNVLQAPDLRRLVKDALGAGAELSATYYEPASNRETLIRLQNNIKIRQIENEDYESALRTVEGMRALDPKEYRLLLDEGVLCARVNRIQDAIDALEQYIVAAPHDRGRHEAALLLQQLKLSLK